MDERDPPSISKLPRPWTSSRYPCIYWIQACSPPSRSLAFIRPLDRRPKEIARLGDPIIRVHPNLTLASNREYGWVSLADVWEGGMPFDLLDPWATCERRGCVLKNREEKIAVEDGRFWYLPNDANVTKSKMTGTTSRYSVQISD